MMRSRTVFSDQELTVIAIESLEFRTGKTRRGGFVTGSLTPLAVIVKEQGGTRVLGMAGQPDDTEHWLSLQPE